MTLGISHTGPTESLSTVFLRLLLGMKSSSVITMHIFGAGVCENWDENRIFYLKNSKEYYSLIMT